MSTSYSISPMVDVMTVESAIDHRTDVVDHEYRKDRVTRDPDRLRPRRLHLAVRRSAADRRPVRRAAASVTFPAAGVVRPVRSTAVERAPAAPPGHAVDLHHPGVPPQGALRRRRDRTRPSGPTASGMVQLGDEVRVEGRLTEADPAELRIGMEVELVIVPFRTDADGTEVMTFAFAPRSTTRRTDDGRRRDHRGGPPPVRPVRRRSPPSTWVPTPSARRSATPASQWKDVQFAFGGSFEVDNPDAVTSRLGLTGIPFMDVYNGCATAATALQLTADAHPLGPVRHRRRRRHGQARARRVHRPIPSTTPRRPGTARSATSSPPSSSP